MKKILSIFGLGFLGMFFFLNNSALFAQKIPQTISQTLSAPVESGMEKLAEAILKLVAVISPSSENEVVKNDIRFAPRPSFNTPECTNDPSLPHSFKKKQNLDWNLSFIVGSNQSWIDVNGDGLIDYVSYGVGLNQAYTYLDSEGNTSNMVYYGNSCVGLNTGVGWEIVYKCFVTYEDDGDPSTYKFYNIVYYGDCADMSK